MLCVCIWREIFCYFFFHLLSIHLPPRYNYYIPIYISSIHTIFSRSRQICFIRLHHLGGKIHQLFVEFFILFVWDLIFSFFSFSLRMILSAISVCDFCHFIPFFWISFFNDSQNWVNALAHRPQPCILTTERQHFFCYSIFKKKIVVSICPLQDYPETLIHIAFKLRLNTSHSAKWNDDFFCKKIF